MAIGGSLRAALRAGNWAKTAMESRRRARALADLNARGGIRGSREMDSLWNRGFDQPFGPGAPMVGYTPRGGQIIGNETTGARSVLGFQHSPIQAPYEGFRVWNPGNDYFNAPPPFVGRGRPPFPDMPLLEQYGYPVLAPSFNDPYSMNVPLAFRGLANYSDTNPASFGVAGGRHPFGGRDYWMPQPVIPFDDVMRTRPMDVVNFNRPPF